VLLKWLETDPMGETHVRESSSINTKNASEYAKRNCRYCHSRGYISIDSGSINGNRINPRMEACSCVLNTLRKMENARNGS